MKLSKKEIAQEIREIDNSGEALEYLSVLTGSANAQQLADSLAASGLFGRNQIIQPGTIRNWFRGGNPEKHFSCLMDFFEREGLLTNNRNDPVVLHINALLRAHPRVISRIADSTIKTIVAELRSHDRALLSDTRTGTSNQILGRKEIALLHARQELIDRLLEKIGMAEEIEDHAEQIASLFYLPHWNDVEALKLKLDYAEIANAVLSKISDPTAHPNLMLMSRFASLLYLDGQSDRSSSLYSRIGAAAASVPDAKSERLLRGIVDYLMAETTLKPDDIAFLFKTGNKGNDVYNKASAERCKGCRLMTEGQFDQARDLLRQSSETLSENEFFGDRFQMLRLYIDVLGFMADWYEGVLPLDRAEYLSQKLIERTKVQDKNEKPLLAGLLAVQLDAHARRLDLTSDQTAQDSRSLVLALQIEDLLKASVPNYCFFNLTQIRDKAESIVRVARNSGSAYSNQ